MLPGRPPKRRPHKTTFRPDGVPQVLPSKHHSTSNPAGRCFQVTSQDHPRPAGSLALPSPLVQPCGTMLPGDLPKGGDLTDHLRPAHRPDVVREVLSHNHHPLCNPAGRFSNPPPLSRGPIRSEAGLSRSNVQHRHSRLKPAPLFQILECRLMPRSVAERVASIPWDVCPPGIAWHSACTTPAPGTTRAVPGCRRPTDLHLRCGPRVDQPTFIPYYLITYYLITYYLITYYLITYYLITLPISIIRKPARPERSSGQPAGPAGRWRGPRVPARRPTR